MPLAIVKGIDDINNINSTQHFLTIIMVKYTSLCRFVALQMAMVALPNAE